MYSKPFLKSLGLDPDLFDPDYEPESHTDSGNASELDLDELAF
ncbi:MAG: hypothetical protein ABSF52_24370 [Syntrophobacteraceae bacterium]|jgi:hypothetical protein